ncbi:MAG: GPP34 family phosphoprotein [Defluviicoccus sp.]|nr:GPP34 family phosphoprotein [Defluviicoccus sp.]MDE0275681.1 GPP34 family phosphoprotein [Defluviicoccus sp.]
MLTFAEEILLLLGDEEGVFLPVEEHAFECALAGAVLMDLAFAYRIDTDLEKLVAIDPAPTGNPMLDRVLEKIVARTDTTDTRTWVGVLSREDAAVLREQALESLAGRGVLERRDGRFLWAFGAVRYPALDDGAVRTIKARIEDVLSDDIPHPRDVALISLVDACEILPDLFPDRDVAAFGPRIALLRRMDLIGREVAGTIADIQRTVVREARARAARFQKLLLVLSAFGGLGVAATLLSPPIPLADRFGPGLFESLWYDGVWKQWSGYLLLGLSVAGLGVATIVKKRLVARIAGSHGWRLFHIVLGIACVLVLFAHTGFRFGANMNAALMAFFVAALLSGALAGAAIGGTPRLRKMGIRKTGRQNRLLIGLHAVAICPLPALLIVHLLSVYLY